MPEDNVPAQIPNLFDIASEAEADETNSAPSLLSMAQETSPPSTPIQTPAPESSEYTQVLNLIDQNYKREELDEKSEDVLTQMKLVSRRFSTTNFNLPAAYIETLEKYGLTGASDVFRNKEWVANIENEARKKFETFMALNEYTSVGGWEVEADKRALYAAFVGDAMLRHTPIYGTVRTGIIGESMRALLINEAERRKQSILDPNLQKAIDPATGLGISEGHAVVRSEMYDTVISQIDELKKLSDADMETLWRSAVYFAETEDRPMNQVEQTIFDERRAWHANKWMPYKAGQILDEKFFGHTPAELTGENRGLVKNGLFQGKKYGMSDYMKMLSNVFGSGWAKVIKKNTDNAFQVYNYNRSGLSKSTNLDVSSPDGVNVFDIVPGEIIQRLETLKLTQGTVKIEDYREHNGKRTITKRSNILEAVGRLGKAAAAKEIQGVGLQNSMDVMEVWSRAEQEADLALRGATPEEIAKDGFFRTAWRRFEHAIGTGFIGAGDVVKTIDRTIVENSPWLKNTIQESVRYWTDDKNNQVAGTVDTVLEAAAISLVHLPNRLENLKAFKEALNKMAGRDIVGAYQSFKEGVKQFKEKGLEPTEKGRLIKGLDNYPWFKQADPKTLRAIFAEEQNASDAYQVYYSRSLAEWDKAAQTLLDDPNASFLDKTLAAVQCSGYGLFHTIAPTFNAILSDPHAGVLMMFAGAAKKPPNPNAMFQRTISAQRLHQHLMDIGTHRPHMVRPIRAKLQEILLKSLDDPNAEGASLAALDDAIGVLGTLNKEWIKTGHFNPKSFAHALSRIWPEITDGMGALGQLLGTKMLEKGYSWLQREGNAVRSLFGKGPTRPNQMISLLLNDLPRTRDWASPLSEVIAIRERVFGSEALWQDVARVHKEFVEKNGRVPEGSEIISQLPEDIQAIHGYMMEADQAAMTNLWDQLGRAMGRGEYAKELQQFAQTATQQLNNLIDTAIQTAHAATEWNIYRTRMSTLAQIAIEKTQNKADRLRLDAAMMRDVQAKQAATPELVDRIIKEAQEKELLAESLDTQIHTMQQHKHRIEVHDFRKGGIGLDKKTFEEALNHNVIEILLDADGALFDGVDASILYDTTFRAAPESAVKEALQAKLDLEAQAKEITKQLRKAQKDPVGTDRRLAELKTELKNLKKQKKEYKPKTNDEVYADGQIVERAPTAEELFDGRIADLERVIPERESAVKASVSDEFYRLAGELIDNKQQYRLAVDKYKRTKKGYATKTLNAKGEQFFWDKIKYDGPSESLLMKHAVEAGDIKSLKSLQKHRLLEENPYLPKSAPLYYQGYMMRQHFIALKNQMAGAIARATELHEIQMKMPAKARSIIGRSQREGVEPVELYKQYPELKNVYDWMMGRSKIKPDDVALWQQVQDYVVQERKFQMELLDLAEARLGKTVLENWKQKLYGAPSYGLYERANLITDPKARDAINAVRKETRTTTSKIPLREEGDRFMFKRNPDKWRVRIEEPDRVIDETFKDKHDARQYLLENYGKETAALVDNAGREGFIEGTTLHGDNLTIGKPFGKTELELLDPATKGYGTPTQRLKAFHDFIRDIHLDGMMDAMNIYGDVIIPTEQFNKLFYTNKALYMWIPDDAKAFGVLAGKYVKRSALSELNRTMKSWDNLSHYMEGLRDAFTNYANVKDVPKEIASKAPGMALKFFNTMGNLARNSLITWSIKAYTQQMPFNLYSNHLTGARVFAPENWSVLRKAFGETGPKGTKLIHELPYYNEMRDSGILTGFYEHKSSALRKEIAEIHGLMSQTEAEALLQRRTQLKKKLEKSGTPEQMARLESDIISIQSRLNELEAGFLRKFGRWLGGFFLDRKNRLGVSQSSIQTKMRQLFSWQDEAFKAATYINLRNKGLTPSQATLQVKRFCQNYSEIPHWFRAATPEWARSLVTSFPFEAARILGNGIRYVPWRTLGWFSILPGLNLLNMAESGVNMHRMEGILAQRGSKSAISDVAMFGTNLFFFDHNTGDLASQLDFGSAIPYGDMVGGYGTIKLAIDEHWPVEQRGMLGHMAGVTAAAASQFYLNRPLFNLIAMGFTGRNTFDGRKMYSDKDSLITKAKIWVKHAAENYVPPLFPGGRDFNGIMDAFTLDEKFTSTGRKTGREPLSAFIKALSSIDARGKLIEDTQDLFGFKTAKRGTLTNDTDLAVSEVWRAMELFGQLGEDLPQLGDRRDMQDVIAMLRHPNLPEADKERLTKTLNEFLAKEQLIKTSTVDLVKSPTERQQLLAKQRINENGLYNVFDAQSIELQAFVLARLDAMKVNDKLLKELTVLALHTERGGYSKPADPQIVRNALKIIQKRVDEAGHSPVMDDMKNGLMKILPVSERLWQREKIRLERKPEIKERVMQRLMEKRE